jgi:hypothetical protein
MNVDKRLRDLFASTALLLATPFAGLASSRTVPLPQPSDPHFVTSPIRKDVDLQAIAITTELRQDNNLTPQSRSRISDDAKIIAETEQQGANAGKAVREACLKRQNFAIIIFDVYPGVSWKFIMGRMVGNTSQTRYMGADDSQFHDTPIQGDLPTQCGYFAVATQNSVDFSRNLAEGRVKLPSRPFNFPNLVNIEPQ